MAIKRGSKELFPYLGDYAPVNIYKGVNKLAGWKWQSESGKVLQFQNGYKDKIAVEVDGKSGQNAGSGKNLAPHPDSWTFKGDAKCENGVVTIPVGSNSASFMMRWDGSSTSLKLSFDSLSGSGFLWNTSYLAEDKVTPVLNESGINSSNGMAPKWTNTTRVAYGTPTLTPEIKWIRMTFTGGTAYTPSEVKIFNILATSSSLVAYEPPAPSPDAPITINSLDKSFDIVSSVGKRNYWITPEEEDLREVVLGHAVYHNKTEVFEIAGYGASSISGVAIGKEFKIDFNLRLNLRSMSKLKNLKPNTEYTMSFMAKHDKQMDGLRLYRLMGFPYYADTMNGFRQEYTFITDKNGEYLFDVYHDNAKLVGKGMVFTISDITITTGYETKSVSIEEVPYDTKSDTIYKTNILLSEPLRSVGDVNDRLFLYTDGLWKVERSVGEKVFDGTEPISLYSDEQPDALGFYWSNTLIRGYSTLYSSHFLKHSSDLGSGGKLQINFEAFICVNGYAKFSILKSRLSSVTKNGVSSWLSSEFQKGNPVKIQYPLLTPTIETLPQSEQVKLNNIQSFKGSNYVYTVANLEPTIHGKMKVKEI